MKTELQIAKENVKEYKNNKKLKHLKELRYGSLVCCNEHKATCQRFLDFLEENEYRDEDWHEKVIYDKIQYLKETIREYDKNGI